MLLVLCCTVVLCCVVLHVQRARTRYPLRLAFGAAQGEGEATLKGELLWAELGPDQDVVGAAEGAGELEFCVRTEKRELVLRAADMRDYAEWVEARDRL